MNAIQRTLRIILIAGILALICFPIGAQPKAPEKSDRKDSPQILDLKYSRTYPFRMEKNPTVSNVTFNYAYEKLAPNATRNAFSEALQIMDTYLVGLVSTQGAGDPADGAVKKRVSIVETTAGTFNQPRTHSILKAVQNSNKNKRFAIEIRFYKQNVVVQPDGTKSVREVPVRTERQTLAVSGGGQAAAIEIFCDNSDAVQLADKLFSLD